MKKSKNEGRSTSLQDSLSTTKQNSGVQLCTKKGTRRVLLKNNNAVPSDNEEQNVLNPGIDGIRSSNLKTKTQSRSRLKSVESEHSGNLPEQMQEIDYDRNDVIVSLHASEDEFEESDVGSMMDQAESQESEVLRDYDDSNDEHNNDSDNDDEIQFAEPTLEQKIQQLKDDPQYEQILRELAGDTIKERKHSKKSEQDHHKRNG